MLELFDLHCDSLGIYKKEGTDFLSERTHFSLRELDRFQRLCQTMAIFIPDTLRGEEAFRYCTEHHRYVLQLLKNQSDIVEMARSADDIRRIIQTKKCAILLAVEGGAALAGSMEHLDTLADMGVKMLTLVWNGDNELGSGHAGHGGGLTSFGKQVVRRMEEVDMVVDVSHLNDQGFADLCSVATKPFIATHSNLRSVCKHPRNLTEAQFTEIVERKGLVGLNLFKPFLSDSQRGTKEDVLRHLYRMLELGGEDIIACGSDFDGAEVDETLNTPVKWATCAEYLVQEGIPEPVVRKIFFENALRFFATQEC